jgi:hypothetical protein
MCSKETIQPSCEAPLQLTRTCPVNAKPFSLMEQVHLINSAVHEVPQWLAPALRCGRWECRKTAASSVGAVVTTATAGHKVGSSRATACNTGPSPRRMHDRDEHIQISSLQLSCVLALLILFIPLNCPKRASTVFVDQLPGMTRGLLQ